jgi:hypothetical protein
MNLVFNSVSDLWATTFIRYIESSILAGKEYLHHEKENIAVMAVFLADSAVEAFKARLAFFSESGAGQPMPNVANEFDPLFVDKMRQQIKDAKPQNFNVVLNKGMAMLDQRAQAFVPASKLKPPRG